MTGIYDTCPECGTAIDHPPGRGKAHKYCGAACQEKAKAIRVAVRKFAPCSVDGCTGDAVRIGAKMCEKHYVRMRRNETTEYVGQAIPGKLEHSHGYVMVQAKGHRRALGGYRAYEHRVVFTNAHGEGPFDCHWCGKVVTWGDMHVDHVDADKKNNDQSNLVASCAICNQKRGRERMMATWRARNGITIKGVRRTINEWGKIAGIAPSSIKARIRAGWEPERAVMEPRGRFGQKAAPQD